MLFDLSGKRKRFLQVVYGFLALIFTITFVGFGIGSDAGGGIFDALGFGGSDGGVSNPQFERQIEDEEAALELDPKDRDALLELARLHFLDGQTQVEENPETGIPDVTEGARSQFEAAIDSWRSYLKTKPKQPDTNVANLIVRAYVLLEDAGGAAEAQAVVAEDSPSSGTLGNLAFYRYADGDIEGGDAAAALALAETTGSTRTSLEKQFKQMAKQAKQYNKAIKDLPEGVQENPIENPFGSLSGSGGLAGTP